ncbi:MAG: Bifunctional protein: zinc-containing alcohol dehydrogenase; quinone oxidoreductase (NADPH:quinone reductase); Similar to arginate lyase, partial [uncultured Rubrobacteraceae bacterium]
EGYGDSGVRRSRGASAHGPAHAPTCRRRGASKGPRRQHQPGGLPGPSRQAAIRRLSRRARLGRLRSGGCARRGRGRVRGRRRGVRHDPLPRAGPRLRRVRHGPGRRGRAQAAGPEPRGGRRDGLGPAHGAAGLRGDGPASRPDRSYPRRFRGRGALRGAAGQGARRRGDRHDLGEEPRLRVELGRRRCTRLPRPPLRGAGLGRGRGVRHGGRRHLHALFSGGQAGRPGRGHRDPHDRRARRASPAGGDQRQLDLGGALAARARGALGAGRVGPAEAARQPDLPARAGRRCPPRPGDGPRRGQDRPCRRV